MATTNSLIDRKAPQIQERLSKTMVEFLAARCRWFREKVMSSMGTYPSDEIGRDWKIIKVFQNPVAGVMESDRGRSEFTLYGEPTTIVAPKFHVETPTNVWPDPFDGPNPNPYRLGLNLKGFLTNLGMTLGEMDAEANPNFIGQILAPKMKAFANMRAQQLELYWWLSQNNDYRLCALSAISSITSTTVSSQTYYTFTFEPDNLACHRFVVGDRLDLYDSTGTDRKNDTQSAAASQTVDTRVALYVAAVSHMQNVVTLASTTDPNAFLGNGGVNPANGDILVYANSKIGSATIKGLAGINSWLKFGQGSNDNFLLGGERDTSNAIDVTVHPEFRSYLKTNVGVLTESKLQRYLQMVEAAMSVYGHSIDTLACSYGISQNYLEQKIGQYQIDRTNRPSSIAYEGNTGDLSITVNGKKYTLLQSMCIEAQTVYGFKIANNWKMIVPPSGKGVQKDTETGFPFEFVAPALGYPSIKVPVMQSSGARTQTMGAVAMPGRIRMQWIPDQPSGMKLTGVTESREYSE